MKSCVAVASSLIVIAFSRFQIIQIACSTVSMHMLSRMIQTGILALAVFALSGCMGFLKTPSEEEVKKAFAPLPPPLSKRVDAGEFELHYREVPGPDDAVVVLIHGSPGLWNNFAHFLRDERLRSRFTLVAVDRPGYGESNPGKSEPSMKAQAWAILKVLNAFPVETKVLLVGHSLAGPIIAEMALLSPDRVDGLLFIGASMDPELEETKWFQYPIQWPILRSLTPDPLRVSNEEILPLKSQLIDLQAKLPKIWQPTIVLQGGKDTLVPAGNAAFLMKHLSGCQARLSLHPELNHFIPFEQPDLVVQCILDLHESILGARVSFQAD
jgi:pimeloyl-ACP methyl ester carboxylesterase